MIKKNNDLILNNNNILFNSFILNDYISYDNKGVFMFNDEGFYLIKFNIYTENKSINKNIFSLNYSINNIPYKLSTILKLNDEIGIRTGLNLSLPSNFSKKFYKGDTLCIKNISNTNIKLSSKYEPNSIILINKI